MTKTSSDWSVSPQCWAVIGFLFNSSKMKHFEFCGVNTTEEEFS